MVRITELDGLRAVAVSIVIASHCQSIVPLPNALKPFVNGNSGVLIFFVLSGFLITRILLEEKERTGTIALGTFYLRRAIRILPASYLYLAVVALAATLGWADVSGQQLTAAFLHFWNYSLLFVTGHPQGNIVLGHFWSLALEEQFYWTWPPILLALSFSRSSKLLVAIIFGMAFVRLGTYMAWPRVRGSLAVMFHTALDPIAIGAALAFYEQYLSSKIASVNRQIITAAIVTLLLAMPLAKHFGGSAWSISYGPTMEGLLAAFVILAMMYRPEHGFAWLMRQPPLQFIGKISFSLYLWQQAFCIADGLYPLHPILSVPMPICAATVSYYGIERPFLKLRRRRAAEPPSA